MTDVNEDVLASYRPALVALTFDLEEMREEMMAGLEGRQHALDWLQRLAIRTLGQLPQIWFHELARQFRGRGDGDAQKTLLAALLAPHARERDLSDERARDLRERLVAVTIMPAYHRAFRLLRKDAGEYIDNEESGTISGHNPEVQRYIAMRPAIDELEGYQQDALAMCLDGLDDRNTIIDWGEVVELATHGEIPDGFASACYHQRSAWKLLADRDDKPARRARELFAATYLIPYFNRGIRDLAGRAGEQPSAQRQERETPYA